MKKLTSLTLAFLLIISLFTGCKPAEQKPAEKSTQTEKTVTDRNQVSYKITKSFEKIASIVPSNTEILAGLGIADKIVVVDNFGADVEGLKKDIVKIDSMKIDMEKILEQSPDLVLASDINKTSTGQDPFKALKDAGILVVYVPVANSLDDIIKDISFIGELTGTEQKAKEITHQMTVDIANIKEQSKNITQKKKVYFEISPAPYLYTTGSGSYLNEIIELIGAENIFALEQGFFAPSAEQIIEKNPDIILTNVNYIEKPIDEIKARKGFSAISAVKQDKIFTIDTNASSRTTQNVIKALKQIAKAVYPDIYE